MQKNFGKIFIGKFSSMKDFYLFSIFIAIVAIVFSFFFLLSDYHNFKSNISAEVHEQNERVRRKLDDSLLYTKHLMRYIGKQISNREGGANDYKFINNLLISYRIPDNDLMSWSTFGWADEKHRVTVTSNYGIMPDVLDLSERDYMARTVSFPETMQMGKVMFGPYSKMWLVPVAYGVVDKNRKYIGAVMTGIMIEALKSQIEESITDRNISFAIIDMKGEIITKSDNLIQAESREFFDEFLGEVRNKISQRNFSYKTGYYQRLGEYPFGIITIYNDKILTATAGNRLAIYLIMIFSLLAFAGFIFYAFHENVISPISELSQIAKKIYSGKNNHKIPEYEITEINDLSKTLGMIDNLVSKQRKK